MLLAMPCNVMGILRQLCDIQQHCRMAERCWLDTTNVHAFELYRPADTKDKEPLPVGVSHHCGNHDLSRIYHPSGSEP